MLFRTLSFVVLFVFLACLYLIFQVFDNAGLLNKLPIIVTLLFALTPLALSVFFFAKSLTKAPKQKVKTSNYRPWHSWIDFMPFVGLFALVFQFFALYLTRATSTSPGIVYAVCVVCFVVSAIFCGAIAVGGNDRPTFWRVINGIGFVAYLALTFLYCIITFIVMNTVS